MSDPRRDNQESGSTEVHIYYLRWLCFVGLKIN
jgi:hypothetical protein